MSIEEFAKLAKILVEKYGWKNVYDNNMEGRMSVKYFQFSLDTRDGEIWRIDIMDGGQVSKSFRLDSQDGTDKLINYLDKEGGALG